MSAFTRWRMSSMCPSTRGKRISRCFLSGRAFTSVGYQDPCGLEEGALSDGAAAGAGASAAGAGSAAGAAARFFPTGRFLTAFRAFFFIAFFPFFFFAKNRFTNIIFGLWKPNKACLAHHRIGLGTMTPTVTSAITASNAGRIANNFFSVCCHIHHSSQSLLDRKQRSVQSQRSGGLLVST